MTPALLLLMVGACRSNPRESHQRSAEATPSASSLRLKVDVDSGLVSPRPASAAERRELLGCDLTYWVRDLGDRGDGSPSTPQAAAGGFLIAFQHYRGRTLQLVTQRVELDGTVHPPVVVSEKVRQTEETKLLAFSGQIWLLVPGVSSDELVELDPVSGARRRGPTPLVFRQDRDTFDDPIDLTVSPRGFLVTSIRGTSRLVRWGIDGQSHVLLTLPESSGGYFRAEPRIASGPLVDMALLPLAPAVAVAILEPGATEPTDVRELLRDDTHSLPEMSIAAGTDGFLVVANVPNGMSLTLFRFDPRGASLGSPTTAALSPLDARRYPVAEALGDGWIVSFWKGDAPAIQRFDGAGYPIGDVVSVHTYDDRSFMFATQIAVSANTLALSWRANRPLKTFLSDQDPARPGPRVAVLRCATEKSQSE